MMKGSRFSDLHPCGKSRVGLLKQNQFHENPAGFAPSRTEIPNWIVSISLRKKDLRIPNASDSKNAGRYSGFARVRV
jgi:hypothetical protein